VGKPNHHPLARAINGYDFAAKVGELLASSGRGYLIKDSLQPYLTGTAAPGARSPSGQQALAF